MPFPLGAVLSAAPGVLGAATDIIKLIRQNRDKAAESVTEPERIDQLTGLVERQAMVIEELAQNNRDLALAVRNNRLLSIASLLVAAAAVVVAVLV
jgi:hypothetical protein